MVKKANTNGSPAGAKGEYDDIIGLVLLALALLLFIAQISFDRHDLILISNPPNHSIHNWIGWLGAHLAFVFFFLLGLAAYVLPFLLAAFGLSRLLDAMAHLRRHNWWSVACGLVLLVSLTGLLRGMKPGGVESICAPSGGGWLGMATYGQSRNYDFGFSLLGSIGSTIVYLVLGCVSLLFLTKFELGAWLNVLWERWTDEKSASVVTTATKADEAALEKRARELERQARKLQEQVEKSGAGGLGADMKAVPEPIVRDLSVPQNKPGAPARPKKGEPAREPAPPDEGIVIPAREVAAATTSDILGKKPDADKNGAPVAASTDAPKDGKDAADAKSADAQAEPVIKIDGLNKPKPRRPKPITVASTPLIGNYQYPSMDFLQLPDTTAKPTESKEELMANARLMQQTLAQFDIEVSLGDITKGPTITRYELHPAPGVKLEKIAALEQQHRRRAQGRAHQHPRAGAGQKLRGRRSAEPRQDQGHHARPAGIRGMEQQQGAHPAGAGQGRLRASHHRGPRRRCRICSSRAAPARASPFASTPSSRRCSTSFRRTSCAS